MNVFPLYNAGKERIERSLHSVFGFLLSYGRSDLVILAV